MAFQMSYTKTVPFQTAPLVYPNAYWVASVKELNRVSSTATIIFEAYADKATRVAGKAQPLATHGFKISGTSFNLFFSTSVLTASNIYAQAYIMAKVTPDPAPKGKTGVIFFANATEV